MSGDEGTGYYACGSCGKEFVEKRHLNDCWWHDKPYTNGLNTDIPAILAKHRRMILEEVVFAVGKEYPFWEASCCDKSVLKALRNVLNNLGIDTEPRA